MNAVETKINKKILPPYIASARHFAQQGESDTVRKGTQ